MAYVTETYASNVDGAGTNLTWNRYTPLTGGPTWPAAVVIHGGGFNKGGVGPYFVAQDLAAAGFLAFAIQYRLAPPHTAFPGQVDPPSDGRPPQQTDDVRAAIRAARADSHCNGKVVVAGFSCGGTHGAWWNIKGTDNDDRPDALVSCSGVFDLDTKDLLAVAQYKSNVENYINHLYPEGAAFHTAAQAASPYDLTIGTTPKPMLLFHSTDEVPSSEFSTMVTKMTNAGGTVESHLRTGTEHADAYWYLSYGGSFPTVKDCSIDFLQRMLSITAPPVVGPASIIVRRK